jgi:hypothetical protein
MACRPLSWFTENCAFPVLFHLISASFDLIPPTPIEDIYIFIRTKWWVPNDLKNSIHLRSGTCSFESERKLLQLTEWTTSVESSDGLFKHLEPFLLIDFPARVSGDALVSAPWKWHRDVAAPNGRVRCHITGYAHNTKNWKRFWKFPKNKIWLIKLKVFVQTCPPIRFFRKFPTFSTEIVAFQPFNSDLDVGWCSSPCKQSVKFLKSETLKMLKEAADRTDKKILFREDDERSFYSMKRKGMRMAAFTLPSPRHRVWSMAAVLQLLGLLPPLSSTRSSEKCAHVDWFEEYQLQVADWSNTCHVSLWRQKKTDIQRQEMNQNVLLFACVSWFRVWTKNLQKKKWADREKMVGDRKATAAEEKGPESSFCRSTHTHRRLLLLLHHPFLFLPFSVSVLRRTPLPHNSDRPDEPATCAYGPPLNFSFCNTKTADVFLHKLQ